MQRFRFLGFTLVELLVVIAILGTLAVVGINTFPASQRRGRDTQRKSDLRQYQVALESYANNHNDLYVDSAGGVVTANSICTTLGYDAAGDCPIDPREPDVVCSGQTCRYMYVGSETEYVLFGAIEQPDTAGNAFWVVCSTGETDEDNSAPPSEACPL
jgi:prepilin-type N-terminal cleavage/methylation domain-containing protein